ncbi:MAG: hypothetical protein Q7S77_03130 [Candidatus Staskawiczbacteria bacterium]|nr:hypothetical protein [Candidatus Staskawiczbacteria bacterium]
MKGVNIEENIKNRIIDLITKGSEDRLIAFKPQGGAESVDLIVKKRGEYKSTVIKKIKTPFKIGKDFFAPRKTKSEEVSFKINIFIGPGKTDFITKDILRESFVASKTFYLIFVYFDEAEQDLSDIWVLSSLDFLTVAEQLKTKENKTMLRFEATIDLEKKDKYSKFLIDKKELGNFLLRIIESKNDIRSK